MRYNRLGWILFCAAACNRHTSSDARTGPSAGQGSVSVYTLVRVTLLAVMGVIEESTIGTESAIYITMYAHDQLPLLHLYNTHMGPISMYPLISLYDTQYHCTL